MQYAFYQGECFYGACPQVPVPYPPAPKGLTFFLPSNSLEGCVRRGFLVKLRTMDWNQPVTIPAAAVQKANRMRSGIHLALWLGTNFPYIVVVFLAVIVWLLLRRERRRRLSVGGQL